MDEVSRCDYRIGNAEGRAVYCQLDDDHSGKHKTLDRQFFTTTESLRYEAGLEHEHLVAALRVELKAGLKVAAEGLLTAHMAFKRLASDQVCDVELTEGNGYIERAIQEAGLFTAAAQAMTDVLLK